MEQTQTKQLKHGRPIDGKGTYRLSKRWNESFSSTYIFKFFFLTHRYRHWFVCFVPCFSLLKFYHIRINIDIYIDLIVPFRVLAWWLKNGIEHVPYFEVFRVLVMKRNKNIKNIFFTNVLRMLKICSVSVY